MTTSISQCDFCKHLVSPFRHGDGTGPLTCSAFPDGVPDEIYDNRADHRQAYPGDGGVRWESRDGLEFPQILFEVPS